MWSRDSLYLAGLVCFAPFQKRSIKPGVGSKYPENIVEYIHEVDE